MPGLIDTIRFSPSQLFTLTACGEAYRRKYIEHMVEGSTPSMIRGSACHAAFEYACKEKLKTGGQPEDYILIQRAWEAVNEFAGKPIYFPPSFKAQGIDNEGALLAAIKSEVSGYIASISGLVAVIDPVEVETARAMQFTVTLDGEKIGIVVEGRRDVKCRINLPDAPQGAVISDLKSAKKVKSKRDADTSLQLTLYAVMESMLEDIPIEQVPVALLSATPSNNGIVLSNRTSRDRDSFLQFLVRAAYVRRKGVFMPCDPTHWKCNPEYCTFHSNCHFIGEKTRDVTVIEARVEVEPSAAVQERDE